MRRSAVSVVLVTAGLLWQSVPSRACSPWDAGCDFLDASTPPSVAIRPQPAAAPRPGAIAASMGLHRVTDVWAGDARITSGSVTTYTTNTIRQDAGTYATRVASVSTGQKSSYDSLLSNGRMSLTDGRSVKGDVYANYVWNGSAVVLDRYVFFQDDLEIRRIASRATPAPTPRPMPTPQPAPTPQQILAVPTRMPVRPIPTAKPVIAAPQPRWTPAPYLVWRPWPTPAPTPAPTPRPTPAPKVVRAGIALASQGDMLGRIEVLRGRRVALWPRATADGVPTRVASWRLISGEIIALGALAGPGEVPLVGTWESLAPLGSSYTLRFALVVEVPGEPSRSIEAVISVVVRSPALVE